MSRRWKGPVPERVNRAFDEQGSEAHEKHKAKLRDWYHRNKEEQRRKARDRAARKRLRNQQWLVNYLADKTCADCQESRMEVLTFDHLDPGLKYGNVADLVSRGAKLEHLTREVSLCEVVCHNCHMLRTYGTIGGTFRLELEPMTPKQFESFREELGV